MQSSLTTYFKAKKRVRDDLSSQKSSAAKLLALSSPTPAAGRSASPSMPDQVDGDMLPRTDSPVPVNANANESTESELSQCETLNSSNNDANVDIKPIPLEVTPTRTPTATPTLKEKLQAQRIQQQALLDKLRANRLYTNVNAEKLLSSPTRARTIPEKEFYSPKTEQDIFTSPVKLCDIKSPLKLSPCGRAVAKRLFNALSKSPTKAGQANSKDEDEATPRKIPAYQRFHALAQKTPEEIEPAPSTSSACPIQLPIPIQTSEPVASSSPDVVRPQAASTATGSRLTSSDSLLQLPFKLKILEELFHALETVSSIFYSRAETITFDKVKPGVHEIMRRVPLKEKHVEQILTVFPDAYTVELDKHTTKNMSGVQKVTYQLIMTINLKSTATIAETLTPGAISERRRIFHENLLKICHKHHEEFLSTLQPPIKIPAGKKVTRWHPRFRLDEVPDIQPEKKLPKPPEPPTSANNAKDVIARAQNILDNANPRMKKALADLLKAKEPAAQEKSASSLSSAPTARQTQCQDNKTKQTLAALKGVSQSLIDKIRAREQEKAIRSMTLTPEENKNKLMMNRLPEFVKSVRNILVAEKKSVMSVRLLVDRLCHSKDGSLTAHEIEDHVRLLCRVLPTWASILKLSTGEYVKINKDANINDLLEKFSESLKNSK